MGIQIHTVDSSTSKLQSLPGLENTALPVKLLGRLEDAEA